MVTSAGMSTQPAGNDEQRHVEVDLHRDGRRQGVDVKEAHRIADSVLDEHALGISGDERLGRTRVVGQQHGGLVITEVEDVELARAAAGERDCFLPHAGGLVLAGGYIEPDTSPSRDGEISARIFGERRRRVMKVTPMESRRASPA